ncbi:MAG: DUF2867 domain-containing protein, partial [candidate division Zixibacteria bacterium HGW-Zixibacteria-1]
TGNFAPFFNRKLFVDLSHNNTLYRCCTSFVNLGVRDRRKVTGKKWEAVEIFEGDVLKPETLPDAFDGVEVVYYLIHSMAAGQADFEKLDHTAAINVVKAANEASVKRIIYLGGLGKRDDGQSKHLRSRHEVADLLRSGNTPLTEFRAAVIIGSGSTSFEMIHHLVNRLPMMICPRWVYTRTQPIGISDVLRYLIDALDKPETIGRTIDIGGPDISTYRDMMLSVARALGLKRFLIQVPVLTPRLSSYWVNLVTPVPTQVARPLIEGLRHETICENDEARDIFQFKPLSLDEAVDRALARVRNHDIETTWTSATSVSDLAPVDPSHLRTDRREIEVDSSDKRLFSIISSIGGNNGWYYADWLWKLRGFIDKQLGGVGLRRGRRHPVELEAGEALDFWRVEEYIPGRKMLLRAEMKVWGQAWLEFEVRPLAENRARLVQTARYYPKGLLGLLYWYTVYPIHALVFKGMVRRIAELAARR